MLKHCLIGLAAASASAQAQPLPDYRIDVTVAPAAGTLRGSVVVTFPDSTPGSSRSLLLGRSYAIRSLTGDHAEVTAAEVDKPIPQMRQITVRATGGGRAAVRVEYEGPLFALGSPWINVLSPELVELAVDSFWIPYLADFGAPFTARAVIRGLPRNAVTVASVPWRRDADGLHLDASGSTRDLALIAAPGLVAVEQGRLRILAHDTASPFVRHYRDHGTGGLAFLESILGPSPTERATVTVVRRANRSGYARPGYVVVTEATGQPGAGQAKFITHEFAHLWFSRASPTGEDYWLVETPAEYLGLRYVADRLGAEAFEELVAPKRDAAAKAPPIIGNGRANDGALYSRGPLLFFELEREIGRPAMDRVLRALAGEPVHSTGLFLGILEREAGADVARKFEAALRSRQP